MKVLVAITPLLLLVAVRAGDPGDPRVLSLSYSDTCDYTERGAMCGNLCVDWNDNCHCGSYNIGSEEIKPYYCCSERCTLYPNKITRSTA